MSGKDIMCNSCQVGVKRMLFAWADTSVMKCCNCGLVFRRMAAELSESELFSFIRKTGDVAMNPTSRYDASYAESSARVVMWKSALSQLEQRVGSSGGRLLDVGSAKGVFLDLARKCGWDPIGVEPLDTSVRYAREVFNLPIVAGTLEEAALPDNYFDVVTMWDVIEHLKDPSRTVCQALRVLKPGGLLFAVTPNHDSLVTLLARLAYGLSFRRLPLEYLLYPMVHLYFFTPTTLGDLVRRRGFRVEQIRSAPLHAEKCLPATAAVTLGASLVDVVGKLVGRPYRMTMIASKPIDKEMGT